jgi:REP element-mobilizing transposase RayT
MMGLFSKHKKNTQKFDKNQDWRKYLKRDNALKNIVEQQGFDFKENIDTSNNLDMDCTKKGLSLNYAEISPNQVKILKQCKAESSADELMKILKRTHKTRFKNDILNPLLEYGFFERTIPEKPKSPKQKYRLSKQFVNANAI